MRGLSWKRWESRSGAAQRQRFGRRRLAQEQLESRELLATFAQAGFETPVQPANAFKQASGTGAGDLTGLLWTFSPGAGITRNTSPFQNNGVQAPEGQQMALIQGTGSISQQGSAFVPGGHYSLTLNVGARLSGEQFIYFDVLMDGERIAGGRVRNDGSNVPLWETTSSVFVAQSATPLLEIRTSNVGGGDNTLFLDNIRVNELTPPAVPTIDNAGFENGPFTPFPQYQPLNAWAGSTHTTGSNAAGGPFLAGKVIPEGSRVGFIQRAIAPSVAPATLSTLIRGLTPGNQYRIVYFENERGNAPGQAALSEVRIDGQVVVDEHQVFSTAEWRVVGSRAFTATSDTATLEFRNNVPVGGPDVTLLLDQVEIIDVTGYYFLDPGFEMPLQPANQFEQQSGTGNGNLGGMNWTFSTNAGITRNTSPFQNNGVQAPEGQQMALIQRDGTISQVGANFVPGGHYSLTLNVGARISGEQFIYFDVLMDGVRIAGGRVRNDGSNVPLWETTSSVFVAQSATPLLEIRTINVGGNDNTLFLDNIRVNELTPPAVPTIDNAGFENGPFTPFPQYQPIDAWAGSTHTTGSNAAGGPFLAGKVIPEGLRVGFLQRTIAPATETSSLSTLIRGLTPGNQYRIVYFENERGNAPGQAALSEVRIDGQVVVDEHQVFSTAEWRVVGSRAFTATSDTATLEFRNNVPAGGPDVTLLLDQVEIIDVTGQYFLDKGFEMPLQPANQFEQQSGTGNGNLGGTVWTFSNNAGITRNTSPFQGGSIQAPEGQQFALIQRAGTITQTGFGFTPGGLYEITVSLAERATNQANDVYFEIDGQRILGGRVTYNGFTDVVSTVFVATSATPTLTISATNPLGTDQTTFIDNIRVTPVAAPTQPTVFNGSFEQGTLSDSPFYQTVDRWFSLNANAGVSTAAGPFVNGLPIPDGARVGFVQDVAAINGGSLSTIIHGLTPGVSYTVQYWENERGTGAMLARPSANINGVEVVPQHDLVRMGQFRRVVTQSFVATDTWAVLELVNNESPGDHTALFDNVVISRAVPVVANGGFETPILAANQFLYHSAMSPAQQAALGWTVTGNPAVSRNTSAFQNGGVQAPEGAQIGILQGNAGFVQTVSGFEAGSGYQLSLRTMARQAGALGNDLEVILDAGLPTEIVLVDIPEVLFNTFTTLDSATFVPTKASYTLTVRASLNGGALTGDRTTYVDDIHFVFISDPPVANNVSAAAAEDGPGVVIPLDADDPDVDDDPTTLTYQIVAQPSEGSVVNNNDGTVTFLPGGDFQNLAQGETRQVTFTYRAIDSHGLPSNTATGTVTVTGVNDAPVASNVLLNVNEDGPAVTNIFPADDVDSDDNQSTLLYQVLTPPAAGVLVDNGDGTFTFDPNGEFEWLALGETTTVNFTYQATDQHGASDTGTVTLTIVGANDAPVADAGGPYTVAEGAGLTFDATASFDPDTSDNPLLTYDWDINGDGLFDLLDAGPTPTLSWAQLQALGVDDGPGGNNVFVRVNDPHTSTTSAAATLTLTNTPPTAIIAGPTGGVPGFEVVFTVSAVDPSAADMAAPFTYTINWGDGSPVEMLVGPAAGVTFAYTYPNFGTFVISATAADKDGGVSPVATHTIDITPVAMVGDDIVAGGDDNSGDRIVFYPGLGGDILVRYVNASINAVFGPFIPNANTRLIAFGQGGNDQITVSNLPYPAYFDGGAGSDYLAGGEGDDTLIGGDGNDTILTGGGNNFADGGAGNDRIEGRDGDDTLFGGEGNDSLSGRGGNDILVGGPGNDHLHGGDGDDLLFGGDGDDVINGYTGDDVIFGGAGDDRIFGDRGNDLLIGGAGVDRLRGDADNDELIGGLSAQEAAIDAALAAMQAGDPTDFNALVLPAWNAWRTSNDSSLFGGFLDDGLVNDLSGGVGADLFRSGANDFVRDLREALEGDVELPL